MGNGTAMREYERRAGRWAMQTSTIIGASTIVAAAIAGTADATTGLPAVSALVGLVAGGLAAIFLPGHDPAPIIAGLQTVADAMASRANGAEAGADRERPAAVTGGVAPKPAAAASGA
ncbi:MAG: hypothetical protein INR65_20265 [Gluconacetobacter diazotrophicus]|nr:hypothetical protein [Gluconacetobacter diazotrophicus]